MDKTGTGCLWFAMFLLLGVPMCDGAIGVRVDKQTEVFEERIRDLEERIIVLESLLEEE